MKFEYFKYVILQLNIFVLLQVCGHLSDRMSQTIQLGRGYCDLNIPWYGATGQLSTKDLIRRALLLGYETIAINVSLNQKELLSKGKERQKAKKAKTSGNAEQDQGLLDFPDPPVIDLNSSDYPDLASKNKTPVVLTRLTLTFSNNDFLPIFNNSKNADKYDILAICPTSALALQNLLKSNFKADMIAFDPENNLSGDVANATADIVRWTRKLYNECVEKNMYFELPYAPAIRDSTVRRRIIRQSHIYHAVGKSKNVIISSDAKHVLELRGPHDVANLGHLFGLNEQQGKFAVSSMANEAIRSAAGRKIGPYRATVQRIEHLSKDERWKIPNSVDCKESYQGSSSDESMEESNKIIETEEKCDIDRDADLSLKVYD